ncbi:MAG: ABC transporter ATP-binding protein [Thermodesulfobacteriota bacterium]
MAKERVSVSIFLKSFAPLANMFAQNRWPLAAGLACLLIVDGLQLVVPEVVKRAVDRLTSHTAEGRQLLSYGLVILALAVAMALFRYFWRYFLLGFSRKVERHLRARLYARLQTLDDAYFARHPTGDLMARMVNDLNAVRMATGIGLAALTDAVVMTTATMAFMAVIDWRLTVLTLLPAPFVVIFTRIYTRRMARGYQEVADRFGDLTERAREAFAGIRVVKAYCREPWTRERLDRESRAYIAENIRLSKSLGMFFPIMSAFSNLGLALVLWYGGSAVIFGRMTAGGFVAFTTYLNLLTWPMMAMGWVMNLVQRGSAAMRRINMVLDAEPEITSPAPEEKSDPSAPEPRGRIEARDLSFTYPGKDEPALSRIRFTIAEGLFVAVVGAVGSGKSTLLSSLPRVLDPAAGTLFVDGRDVRDIPLPLLRRTVALATQDAVIFSDSVAANVSFSRGLSGDRISSALAAAALSREVAELPKGDLTLLGERGITLSGGQRQRLALARALALDPPVLLLDDCLSMVDVNTEKRIVDGLLSRRKGKTTVLVTHRAATIRRADLILVMDQGRLAQQGVHRELIGQEGPYKALYEKGLLAEILDQAG